MDTNRGVVITFSIGVNIENTEKLGAEQKSNVNFQMGLSLWDLKGFLKSSPLLLYSLVITLSSIDKDLQGF